MRNFLAPWLAMTSCYSGESAPYSNNKALVLDCCYAGYGWLLGSKNRLLGSLCVFLILAFLLKGIYNRYLHPLRRFPGPFWASVTDFHKLYILSSSDLTNLFLDHHKKYGRMPLSLAQNHTHIEGC